MDCQEARDFWHERCDGELTSSRQTFAEHHLRACAKCRIYYRQMDEMATALAGLRESSQTVGAGTNRGAAAPSRRRLPVFAWRISRVAAALALMVGAGLYLSRRDAADLESTGGSTPLPTVVPGAFEQPAGARIVLGARSAATFIPVARQSEHRNVHVFVLYRTVGDQTPDR